MLDPDPARTALSRGVDHAHVELDEHIGPGGRFDVVRVIAGL
jgi:hypothetical protein